MFSLSDTNPNSWKEKGNKFFKEKKYEEAINCYKKAIEFDADFKPAWLNLGLCFQGLDDKPSAYHAFSKAITIDSQYSKAVFGKTQILLFLDKKALAIEELDRYIANGGEDEQVKNLRIKVGLERAAELTHQTRIKTAPALLAKGEEYEQIGEFNLAIKYFDAAMAIFSEPRFAEALRARARLASRMGESPMQLISQWTMGSSPENAQAEVDEAFRTLSASRP